MSLVEKALKKLQDSRSAAAAGASLGARGPEAAASPSFRGEAPAVAVPPSGKFVAVNLSALRSAGLLSVNDEERRIAAEYRHIKRPLIAGALGRGTPPVPNGRTIMVASALPGEGKTFTSVNLAFAMALEKDTSVLLVDCDLPKPQISRVFGVSEEPGLVDALLDETVEPESLVVATNVRGLSLLPAGRSESTATELLASNRMERLIASLLIADPRRIVLFDSSPLLLTTESRALASAVGQIIIVVRAESTTHQAVQDAVGCVPEGKSVGLILNQSRAAPAHVYYGYGDYGDRSPSDD
jgi:exopolysaccharide/PEP-CTERM locus tyrosine autokinase